jgi:hypothetical protein
MGYFSNIIKDCRVNPDTHDSLRRSSAVPETVSYDGAAGALPMFEGRSRIRSTGRSPIAPLAETERIGDNPQAFLTASAEIRGSTRPKGKRTHAVSRIQNTRTDIEPSADPTKSAGSPVLTGKHDRPPVIQRKEMSASGPRPTMTARSAAGNVKPSEPQTPTRPQMKPVKARPAGPSRQSSGDAISQSFRPAPTRKATSTPNRPPAAPREAAVLTHRQSAAPGPGKPPRKNELADLDSETAHRAGSVVTSAGQSHRMIHTGVPVEATLKVGAAKPDLSVSLPAAAPHGRNAAPATAAHDDTPRVRIGQVNVIVEESRVPARTSSSSSRTGDLASRSFLRSL